MQVKRIVANIAAEDIAAARRFFHQDILGLDVLMDHGWIATYGSSQKMSVQVRQHRVRRRLGHAGVPISRSKSMISTLPCSA